jgi:hypothetical protein
MGELASDLRNVSEMPSVVPGDAFEPPTWELVSTPPSKPPPLPRVSAQEVRAELVSIVMQSDGSALAAHLSPLPLAAAGGPLLAAAAGAGAGAAPAGAFGPGVDADEHAAHSARWQAQTRSSGRGSRRAPQPATVVSRFAPHRAQRFFLLAAMAAALGLLAGHVVRNAGAPTLAALGGAEAAAQPATAPAKLPLALDTTTTLQSAIARTSLSGELQPNGLATPAVVSELEAAASASPTASDSLVAEPEVPTPQGSIAPAGPDTKSPNLVEVQVRTDPSGAKVRAVGTGAHCRAAPCALSVPRGRPVTLRAETGRNSVERTLTFEDKSEVELRLSAITRPPKPPPRSDLKIPAIFRDGN